MNERADKTSRFVSAAIELLLISYPTRTSLGVVLGLVLDFFFQLLYPLILQVEYLDPERISRWQFIPLGILIAHLPTIFGFFLASSHFPEVVENAIRMIETSNLSREEKRQQYRALIEKVLENVALNKATDAKIKAIQEQLRHKTSSP